MNSDPFDVVKKYNTPAERQQQADPTEGRIRAVLICSHVLDACIWFALDADFRPPDDDEELAVFYSDEIPFIAEKTVDNLKKYINGSSLMVRERG